LSFDHDPLFEFDRWQANLRILEIQPMRSVPHAPRSQDYASYCTSLVRFARNSRHSGPETKLSSLLFGRGI
jgi:hypothetical protein